MNIILHNSKHFLSKFLQSGFIGLLFSIASSDLSEALIFNHTFLISLSSDDRTFQKEGFIKGRITEITANAPVCFADIYNSNMTSFAKSNSKGDFSIGPLEFPATLSIRKFGFREETLVINDPIDPVLITLTPLEVHKSYSGNKTLLQYNQIFRKALEKFQSGYNSGSKDNSIREFVYSRICTTIDTCVNSLFESYALMNVSQDGFQDYQSCISRYALTNYIPGLTGNILEFNVDPYVNLPMFDERSITRKTFIMQDGKQIAMIQVDLGNTKSIYYINVADTSILYITSEFKSGRNNRIPGFKSMRQRNKTIYTEISFSHNLANREDYFIDWVSTNEEFRLSQKNKPDEIISKSILFTVVPDSSMIINAVRDQVSQEALTEMRQQINFRAKYFLSYISSDFNSETEKLQLKPYIHVFWAQNSCVTPDIIEHRQIKKWENNNLFYSESFRTKVIENTEVDSLVSIMNNNLVTVENVYVETDRLDYLAGDTIWFSAFVMQNLHMDSTSLSKILYVDLINSDNIPEKHLKLFIRNGRSNGDLIIRNDAKDGIYRLRAYTQYMRNFQGEYLFEKDITVHQSDFNNMINVNPVIKNSIEGDSVELYLKTILPDEYMAQDKRLEVIARLNDTLSVRKTFNIKKYLNEWMGFFVPSSLSCPFVDVKLVLSDKAVISEQRLSIPLKSGINLQFFPESGKMVDGINAVIAFKASDNKGNPTGFHADIVDENKNIIKHISGDNSGVGKFDLTPENNHSYKALINLSGTKYSFNLPDVEPMGYVLNFNSDSSDILISNNLNNFNSRHYLFIAVRGVIYNSIETKLDDKPLRIHLPLKTYPKGIVQVTLLDSLFRPLAERLVFNNRTDQKMFIKIETDKNVYLQREKVTLTLSVTDAADNPVRSSLAVAVADSSKCDSSISSPDIESYLYLSSELKGKIDFKLLNLSDTTSDGNTKRDLIMMTQGWRNYLWNSIRYTTTLKVLYPIEKGFWIDGTVYNFSNQRSCNGYMLNYFDFKSGFNGTTRIDEKNTFKIDIPLFYNSRVYFIQSMNMKDRIVNLGFNLDTIPIPGISYRNNELPYKSYKAGYLKTLDNKFMEIDSTAGEDIKYHNLPEVKITAKSNRSGYSAPDIMINLNKEDPTGKKYQSLFQLIYAEFGEKAFTASGFDTNGKMYNPILVVNGASLTASECPPCYDFRAYSWATAIPVNEISDVKFYEAESDYSQWLTPPPATKKFIVEQNLIAITGHQFMRLLPPDPKIYLPVVSVKTYSNSYRGNPRGAIIFPFQGLYMAREFYQPLYENKTIRTPDNRTTIYWNPEVLTDSAGTATVSFYNSDLKGKALIRISGVSFYLKDASTFLGSYLSN